MGARSVTYSATLGLGSPKTSPIGRVVLSSTHITTTVGGQAGTRELFYPVNLQAFRRQGPGKEQPFDPLIRPGGACLDVAVGRERPELRAVRTGPGGHLDGHEYRRRILLDVDEVALVTDGLVGVRGEGRRLGGLVDGVGVVGGQGCRRADDAEVALVTDGLVGVRGEGRRLGGLVDGVGVVGGQGCRRADEGDNRDDDRDHDDGRAETGVLLPHKEPPSSKWP